MQNPNQMISKTMIFDEVALSLRNMGKSEEEIRENFESLRTFPISELAGIGA